LLAVRLAGPRSPVLSSAERLGSLPKSRLGEPPCSARNRIPF
jgi:hypothetical protein